MTIRVNPISDNIRPSGNNTVSGVVNTDMQGLDKIKKKQYKPSLFSIHIFPWKNNEQIFVQNGVVYARCIGETLELKYCDDVIKQLVNKQNSQATLFQLPDFRNRILKHTVNDRQTEREITSDNLAPHTHDIQIHTPIHHEYSHKNTDEQEQGLFWEQQDEQNKIDIVLTETEAKPYKITNDVNEPNPKINISDSSLNVVYCMVVGYK